MRVLLVLLATAGLTTAVAAESNSIAPRSLSLDECIQTALEHNFDVQIVRYNPQLSLFNLRAAYAGWDPVFSISGQHDFSLSGGGLDPVTKLPSPSSESDDNNFRASVTGGLLPFGTTYNVAGSIQETYGVGSVGGVPTSFDSTRGGVSTTLSQPLLKNFWIDGTRLNITVSKNRLKYSEQGLRLQLMNTVTDVEGAYFDLIAARENVKAQEQGLRLADRLLSENKRRVEVGALAPLDEKQAASQVAARRAELQTALQQLGFAQNTLKRLISDKYREVHPVDLEASESLSAPVQLFNIQDSWGKGMTLRPEFLQAKLDVERQGVQLRYDKNQLFPELDLFGTYGHSAGGAAAVEFNDGFFQIQQGNQPLYTYGARLSVPLSNVGARNAHKASKVALEQVLLALKKMEQEILVQIDNSIIAARTSYERVGSTREARLYAEAALDAEQKKLESGKSTSFVVLQLQRDLTGARSAEIQALADYNKSLAALARSEGSTLDRRGLDLRFD